MDNSLNQQHIFPPCIILAGGLGTRLRSVVADRPKCLAPIGSSTVIGLHVQALVKQGFKRFVLSLAYMAEQFEPEMQRLGQLYPDCELSAVVEPELLGTGGAVLYAMHQLQLDEAIVTNGDTLSAADFSAFSQDLQLDQGELLRMGLVQVADRSRYGGVRLEGERVSGFYEKGRVEPGLINAGIYRLHVQAFAAFQAGQKFSMETDILAKLAEKKAIGASLLDRPIVDIGLPADYLAFCQANQDRWQ